MMDLSTQLNNEPGQIVLLSYKNNDDEFCHTAFFVSLRAMTELVSKAKALPENPDIKEKIALLKSVGAFKSDYILDGALIAAHRRYDEKETLRYQEYSRSGLKNLNPSPDVPAIQWFDETGALYRGTHVLESKKPANLGELEYTEATEAEIAEVRKKQGKTLTMPRPFNTDVVSGATPPLMSP